MNNTIFEMSTTKVFAEYETLCSIGEYINKQILMESYFQEAEGEKEINVIPPADVTTFQKFKNWVRRIITLIKRNTSKFSRAIEKWMTKGIMGELYKDQEKGKKIKVQKALVDCLKYIVDDDYIKQMLATLGIKGTTSADNWINPVVKFNPNGNYVSLGATLDREIKKCNPYLNKLAALKSSQDGVAMVEVKFEDLSKNIKALQQKSDDMANSIKEVDKLMIDEKKNTTEKDKNFDHYVAAMTSLMEWLLVQSNLILYIGMLIPLIGVASEDTPESNQQVKKD